MVDHITAPPIWIRRVRDSCFQNSDGRPPLDPVPRRRKVQYARLAGPLIVFVVGIPQLGVWKERIVRRGGESRCCLNLRIAETIGKHVIRRHQQDGRFRAGCRSAETKIYFSSNVKQESLEIFTFYKSRFQIEFLFRDGKQFVGVNTCATRVGPPRNSNSSAFLSGCATASKIA